MLSKQRKPHFRVHPCETNPISTAQSPRKKEKTTKDDYRRAAATTSKHTKKKAQTSTKKIQDDYKKFYEQFGKCLKLGVHEDRGPMFPAWNYLHMTMCVCVVRGHCSGWFKGQHAGFPSNSRVLLVGSQETKVELKIFAKGPGWGWGWV